VTTLDSLRGVDVYLIDQLLKGRIAGDARVLDVGCGGGRNLRWFEAHGHFAVGIDQTVVNAERLRLRGDAAALPFRDAAFDVVVAVAVLHFARDAEYFGTSVDECWRVLRPGGLFFARLATTMGIEDALTPLANGWYALPDGTERYLVNADDLHACEARLGARPLEPLKSTLVENQRSMATWVLGKR
jgi:SAM-dependent methyltransferase